MFALISSGGAAWATLLSSLLGLLGLLGLILSPSTLRRVEDNMRVIYTSAWARRQKNLWWRRVAKFRPSSTKKELLQWMLETAQIRPADGARFSFDDLMEHTWSIENEKFAAALRLSRDEIEDALGSQAATGGALDRAANWARHVGNSGAYWPQLQAAGALKNGKTNKGYDGLAFFHAAHPVNPVTGGGGTYKNLHTAKPFSGPNLASVSATIEAIKAPDGSPRHLVPRIVIAGPDLRLAVTEVLGAETFTDPLNAGGTASATNVVKTLYDFEPPIVAPELDEAGVWYLGCELVEDDELGGIIYQERKPFSMTSYSPQSDVVLGLMDAFEWQLVGRNATTYGHPFLLHRVEPT